MKIYLLRHTETIEGKKGIILGTVGGNLSKEGRKQARNIGQFLKESNFGIKQIYTSPLQRAFETAKIINIFLHKKIFKKKILQERSAGESEGKKESEIDWKNYEQAEEKYRKHKGGENFIEVQNRAKVFLESLQGKNENILVVSHSVIICMIISLVKNITIEKALGTPLSDKIICIDLDQSIIESMIRKEL